jgi:hypothetical protein
MLLEDGAQSLDRSLARPDFAAPKCSAGPFTAASG